MASRSSLYAGGAHSSNAPLAIPTSVGVRRADQTDSSGGGMRQHPLLVLEQLSSQCMELHELRLICEQLCARLTLLTTRLGDDSSASARTESDDSRWTARVEMLIAQFAAFVERNARSNAVRRLTDVHRLRELYELQVQVDAVFRATRSEHVDIAANWQSQWSKDIAFTETQLERVVTSRELLRRELGGSANLQREALALVKFAAENLQLGDKTDASTLEDDGEQAEYRASQVALFKRVFRILLTVAVESVAVPVIPAWFISPNDVTVHKSAFTSGSGADIHYGEWLPLAKTVIVKRIPVLSTLQFSGDENSESERAFMREALLWYPLNHPNMLKILGGCHVSTPPFLVYESPSDGSQTLDDYLATSSSSVSRPKVFHALYQAALGLQYLHEQHRLVHNDLQCRNILVSADGNARVCNFASATWFADADPEADIRVLNRPSSLRWAAPETLLKNGEIDFASDVYGLGMCILEAVSGDVPWGFLDDETIKKRIMMAQLPELDDDARVDPEIWRLIAAMCSFEAASRPTIISVVDSLRLFVERERRESRDAVSSSSSSSSRELQRANSAAMSNSQVLAPDYSQYRHQLSQSRGSMSDTRSVHSDTSSSLSKDDALQQLRAQDTVSVVTLHQKWLGIKINSIGTKIVVSKFLRSASGAMGEIEASGSVTLGDTIYAVNNQTVRGMNRHQIGSFIQSIPRPLQLSFKREAALLDECFRFNGLRIDERWRDRGSALPLPGSLDRLFGSTSGCFSFELWFSLADVSDSFFGGILFGAQDIPIEDASWAYIHRQLVNVDPHGNLCVSLLNNDTPALVARELTPSIWYHLVVTYSSPDKQLAVYLDGELRHSSTGSLHREWQRLSYVNVGSGCISGISPAKPTPDFTGWYGFNGLVYDFKIWRALLGDLEVHQLFRGATDCVDIPSYAMKRDLRKKTLQGAQYPERVRATRPQHVVAQVY